MSEFVPLVHGAPVGGFRGDPRLGAGNGWGAGSGWAAPARAAPEPPEPEPEPEEPAVDPLALAWADGHALGLAEGRAEAEARARADAAAAEGLAMSFARLDRTLEEELRLRLRDTVAALCEAAILPLALDEEALARRVEVAVSMLARADDDRVIRLHPDDMALVSPRLTPDWRVEPDPALERGSLRVETASGGVEDGPATWRRAIAEALHQC